MNNKCYTEKPNLNNHFEYILRETLGGVFLFFFKKIFLPPEFLVDKGKNREEKCRNIFACLMADIPPKLNNGAN